MTADLIIGIASSAIFACLIWLYNSQLHPRISGALQKVPNIAGRWDIIATDEGKENVGHVEFTQRGPRINGKYYRRKRSDSSIRSFTCQGSFASGQLVMTFEETANKGHNVGSMVLKLSSDGRKLTGLNVYLHHDSGQVRAVDALLEKQISMGTT